MFTYPKVYVLTGRTCDPTRKKKKSHRLRLLHTSGNTRDLLASVLGQDTPRGILCDRGAQNVTKRICLRYITGTICQRVSLR